MHRLTYGNNIPREYQPELRDREVPVYNHMPSWLLLEALLFLIPNVAWQLFARRLGCPLSIICSRVQDFLSFTSQEATNNAVKEVVYLIRGYCTGNRRSRKTSSAFFRCYGNLLYIGYLLLMVMHTANVIAQFFVLSSLLQIPFYRYGFEALEAKSGLGIDPLVHTALMSFPHVVFCDFTVRRVGTVHRYSAQCSLLLSDFNASLLLFIWFFLFVVACLSAIGTVIFFFEFLFGGCIGKDVAIIICDDCHSGKGLDRDDTHYPTEGGHRQASIEMTGFGSSFLGRDGLFLLHMISENAGSVIAERVIIELWRSYQGDQSESHRQREERAIRETSVHSDVMAGEQGNSSGGQAVWPTVNIAGSQHMETPAE